jgi:DNA polymerase-3 subunit delta
MILNRRPDIDRFLAGPGPEMRAAVIHGRDMGVVRERGAKLAATVTERPADPFDAALLTDQDLAADSARLEGELAAISMLGGRRLVRLRLANEGLERAVSEALGRHLAGDLNPEAFFIVEAGVLRRDGPLLKLALASPGCGVIACYEDEQGDLARMTREALSAEGLALDLPALQAFTARLPHDRGVARREIERLVLFLGPGRRSPARLDELDAFFGVEPDTSLADAALHAFGGRLAAAQAELHRAALEGEMGVPVVRALGTHALRLRRASALRAGGAEAQAAAKSVGVFWKIEREFVRQSGAWTEAALATAQSAILVTDAACKASGAPDRLLAEHLAFEIAAQARRLGL